MSSIEERFRSIDERLMRIEEKIDILLEKSVRNEERIQQYEIALEGVRDLNDSRWSMTKTFFVGLLAPMIGTLLLLIYEVITG